jgi:hypothetical protein
VWILQVTLNLSYNFVNFGHILIKYVFIFINVFLRSTSVVHLLQFITWTLPSEILCDPHVKACLGIAVLPWGDK